MDTRFWVNCGIAWIAMLSPIMASDQLASLDRMSGAGGGQGASVSDSGQLVLYRSASNSSLILHNRSGGTEGTISIDAAAGVISGDGSLIAYSETAGSTLTLYTKAVSGSTSTPITTNAIPLALSTSARFLIYRNNATSDLVYRDLQTSTETPFGLGAFSPGAAISGDGNLVAYLAPASNSVRNVFLRNMSGGTTQLVSHAGTNPSNGSAEDVAISKDGSVVAFISHASDLVANDTNVAADVFLYSVSTGMVTRPLGNADDTSESVAINSDATIVAFTSKARNLVVGDDQDHVADAYRLNRGTGEVIRVSPGGANRDLGPFPTQFGTGEVAVSASGNLIFFHSDLQLVASDTDSVSDVYVATITQRSGTSGGSTTSGTGTTTTGGSTTGGSTTSGSTTGGSTTTSSGTSTSTGGSGTGGGSGGGGSGGRCGVGGGVAVLLGLTWLRRWRKNV